MSEIILTLLGLFFLWPVCGAVAYFLFKRNFLVTRAHSNFAVIVSATFTATFLTPVIVIAGHNPFIVPLYLFPLFPQTGFGFLVPSFVVVGLLATILARRAFRSNSAVEMDAPKAARPSP